MLVLTFSQELFLCYNKKERRGRTMRELIIHKNDANQRVDKFIAKAVPLLPTTLMYKMIRNKKIKVNRKRCEISQRLQEGDVMQLFIAEEFFEHQVNFDFLQCTVPLDILYEDEHVIMICKPVGISVHADEKFPIDNVANALKKYLFKEKVYQPEKEHSFTPALVNRIDRNTMGIVIGAKDAQTLKDLNQVIQDHQLHKYYLALVEGTLKPKKAHLTMYHQKDEIQKIAKVSPYEKEGYKEMITEYQVIRSLNDCTLVDIQLFTGRFHQIRAQFAFLGYPLYGDAKYGAKKQAGMYQALCAYKVRFGDELPNSLRYLANKTFQLDEEVFLSQYQ